MSLIIKPLGVLLVFIGLLGMIGCAIGIKMVHDYNFGGGELTKEVEKASVKLTDREKNLRDSLSRAKINLLTSSSYAKAASKNLYTTSERLSSASAGLEEASTSLEEASSYNTRAAQLLKQASAELKEWADAYEYNGSSLPEKYKFKSAVSKIDSAAQKLELTGEKLQSTSQGLNKASVEINSAHQGIKASSANLANLSTSLKETGESLGKVVEPLGNLIKDIVGTLQDAKSSLSAISKASSNIKLGLYAVLGYMFVFHIILVLLGISLIIIEANLFY